MKKLRLVMKIVTLTCLSVIALVSLIYLFTNVRLLFSGDMMVYSSPASGILTCIGKIIMYAFLIFYTVFSYFYIIKKYHEGMNTYYLVFSICYLLIAFIYILFNKVSILGGVEGIIVNVTRIAFPVALFSTIMSYVLDFLES